MFAHRPILAVGLLTIAFVATPTDARTAWADAKLCSGYVDCRDNDYSDFGYNVNSENSYWRMVAGHNCTNYVAYRLVHAGLPNDRPPADPGQSNDHLSAYRWGTVYASRTDDVPSVGSVAWWDASAHMGEDGHVAYVEAVGSDGSVTISEDSSSGNDFDWKKIAPGRGWPNGFIHFDAPAADPDDRVPAGDPDARVPASRVPASRVPTSRPPASRVPVLTQPAPPPAVVPPPAAPMGPAPFAEPAKPARMHRPGRPAHRAHRPARPHPVGDCSGAMASAVCPAPGADAVGRASLRS